MDDAQYPLIPPELLQYTLLHESSLSDRTDVGSTSLLRFLSRPGHYQGEGYRRIYIGRHPDDAYEVVLDPSAQAKPSNADTTDFAQSGGAVDDDGSGGSRSFLVGVQTLWELERREQNRLRKGKGRAISPDGQPLANGGPAVRPYGPSHADQVPAADRHSQKREATASVAMDTISADSGSSSGSDEDENTFHTEDEHSSPPTSVSKRGGILNFAARGFGRNKARSETAKHSVKMQKGSDASLTNETSADKLLKQLSSKDAKKKLSSGVSDNGIQRTSAEESRVDDTDAPPVPQDVLSRRALGSPSVLTPATSNAVFYDANSYLDGDGKRTTGREVSDEVKKKVKESFALETEPQSETRHELLRRVSDTLVPETASDTFVLSTSGKKRGVDNSKQSRPTIPNYKSTKSVRWDVSNGQSLVPGSRGKSQQPFAPGSGDQPASDPSQVLARPEPLEQPAEQVPDNIPPLAQLERSHTSAADRELARLAEVKEASLPPGSEKLERMLVRACWTKKQNFTQDFDELAARRLKLEWMPWEEMAVLWRKNHLEIYGTHVRRTRPPT